MADISDDDLATRFEYSNRLGDRLPSIFASLEVVDRKTGDDKIELSVVIRQRRDIAGVQFHAILDAAGSRIVFDGFDVVAGLVTATPQVDASDPAPGQSFGKADQDRAATAAEINCTFVALQSSIVEQLGPPDKLAVQRRL